MTDFGPTRAEMIFRLLISGLGIVLIVTAVAFRGLPTETVVSQFLLMAFAFLVASALVTGKKLRHFSDD